MDEKNSLEAIIGSLMPAESGPKGEKRKDTADKSLYTRQINAFNAAIPFLDREYQKNVFIIVKLLELRRFLEELPAVAMQSREKGGGYLNAGAMAEAVRKNLNEEEKRSFDMLYKIFMLKNLAGGKNSGL